VDEKTITQLRASLRRSRPWTLPSCLLLLLLLGGGVGLLIWWMSPRSGGTALTVAAFDQVVVEGEKPTCRAKAEPLEAGGTVEGRDLTFEVRGAGPGGAVAKARTGADGVASVTLTFPVTRRAEFRVRHVFEDRQREAVDRARVFAFPREAKVLLVDVGTLTTAGEKIYRTDFVEAPLLAGAAGALHAARGRKWSVVYLALGTVDGATYRRLRNWVERSAVLGDAGIPDGPVLGQLSAPDAGEGPLPPGVLRLLKGFKGPLVLLSRDPGRLEAARAAAIEPLAVGQGERAWDEVAQRLPK
jgi:hypothetical protein